jgi:hypothetical protein
LEQNSELVVTIREFLERDLRRVVDGKSIVLVAILFISCGDIVGLLT